MPLDPSLLEPQRAIADLRALADLTGGPEGSRRLCWGEDWARARELLRERLAALPVEVETDEIGNVWATLEGERPDAVVVGSHVDSVPNGGWLDGALGVMGALEVLRAVAAQGVPPCSVRLVDFADEEGARFGRSLFGSSAVSGTLVPDDVRDLRDAGGARLEDVMTAHGIDLDRAAGARARLDDVRAYLELHIEQGPVLESEGLAIGAVLGTVGVERHRVVFSGQAAHAGSTPIRHRRDAFLAAARCALELREIAVRHDGVCTVGRADCAPGVATAVPGTCALLVDQRHLELRSLEAMLRDLRDAASRLAAAEGCTVTFDRVWRTDPVPFDPALIAAARTACREVSGSDRALPSGALHDATEMARHVPTAMIFSSSVNGISHAKEEDTPEEHLELAIRAFGVTALRTIDAVGAA